MRSRSGEVSAWSVSLGGVFTSQLRVVARVRPRRVDRGLRDVEYLSRNSNTLLLALSASAPSQRRSGRYGMRGEALATAAVPRWARLLRPEPGLQ